MAIADGGELIVLAPGVDRFGEDSEIDRLIRCYGYAGTDRILEAVAAGESLRRILLRRHTLSTDRARADFPSATVPVL